MKLKKAGFGILIAVFTLSFAMVGVGSADAITMLKSGENNLGSLFVLDKLFNESEGNSRILSKDKTNLGDLFILSKLFTEKTPQTVVSAGPAVTPGPTVAQRVSGRIVIQTEENGEAWYVYPVTNRRVFLGEPAEAFAVMADLSLGVSNNDYNKIASGDIPSNVVGKFIIKVDDFGKMYYVDPVSKDVVSVGSAGAAINLITKYGLGISNTDINKIAVGNTSVAVAN